MLCVMISRKQSSTASLVLQSRTTHPDFKFKLIKPKDRKRSVCRFKNKTHFNNRKGFSSRKSKRNKNGFPLLS